jgi:ribosomal protein L16 Arg81 hydroxylase
MEQRFLHRERHNENGFLPTLTTNDPIININLKEGDFLWIPALYPHAGITISEGLSISLSLVWAIPSNLKLFYVIREALDLDISTVSAESKILNLYSHVWADNENAIASIENSMKHLLDKLNIKLNSSQLHQLAANYAKR